MSLGKNILGSSSGACDLRGGDLFDTSVRMSQNDSLFGAPIVDTT